MLKTYTSPEYEFVLNFASDKAYCLAYSAVAWSFDCLDHRTLGNFGVGSCLLWHVTFTHADFETAPRYSFTFPILDSWALAQTPRPRTEPEEMGARLQLTNVVLASIKEEMSGTRIAIGYLPVSLTAVCNNPTALDYMQRMIPNLYQAVVQSCPLLKNLSSGVFQLAWHAEPTAWFGTAGFLAELWYSKTTKTRRRPRDQPKPPAPANNPWQPSRRRLRV